MGKFAKGKWAVGICGRSGKKMLLKDMVEDGDIKGLLVDPAWRDIAHPADKPVDLSEGIALKKPAPDTDNDNPNGAGQSLVDAWGFTNYFGGGT